MTWYVVHGGCQTRLFFSLEACHAQVNGFKGACYKGYKSKDEALATLSSDEQKIEIKRAGGHPLAWKDVIILVEGVIIFILICIVFCQLN
jgi:viroplasmin and RNaseH domain-containing protein